MKIYTKTGDDGTTGLIGGQRVSKADARIDCCGTVDELNASIGLAAVVAEPGLLAKLRRVQNELFVMGSGIASTGAATNLPVLTEQSITRLEKEIDDATSQLTPLRNFILPGGTEISARLHLARTVCRRAERVVVGFTSVSTGLEISVRYLNRLSDWLFTQARLQNARAGVGDVEWEK
jgi:cob(I)alamin adenosyltransferase